MLENACPERRILRWKKCQQKVGERGPGEARRASGARGARRENKDPFL